MKFQCVHCSQRVEARDDSAGETFVCPACGGSIVVPAPISDSTALAASAAGLTKSPPGWTHQRSRQASSSGTPLHYNGNPGGKRGGSGGKWFFVLILLVVIGGYCADMVRYNESPQQVWQRITGFFENWIQPKAAPSPAPAATASPVPKATPAATPEPTPKATATPNIASTPSPDPLGWILTHKGRLPKEVVLLETTDFPAVFEGKVVGSARVPAGSRISVLQIEAGAVTASFEGGIQRLPVKSTDLLERVRIEMAKPEPEPTPEISQVPVPQAPAPTPFTGFENDADAGQRDAHSGFIHPGLLNTEADFERMRTKVRAGAEPWAAAYKVLTKDWTGNSPKWVPHPFARVIRGGSGENFATFANDIAVAYGCALRWKISGETGYAKKAVQILNALSSTMTGLGGDPNIELLEINGYQLANVGEIMRSYPGWPPEDFGRFQKMMKTVFYAMAHDFLTRHDGQGYSFMWANWDLLTMDAIYAIGVLCDDRALTTEATDYFYNGVGEGCINRTVYFIHPGYLGQTQESGRDQGHNTLEIALLAPFCEMAWHQGVDLYGYENNRVLAGAEYVAKYNLMEDVPFVPYSNETGFPDHDYKTSISSYERGASRGAWELIYNHYVNRKGLAAPYSAAFAAKLRPTGYSGGDQPGFDTLTASLDPIPAGANPSGLTAIVTAQQPVLSWWGSAYATGYNVKRATTRDGSYTTIANGLTTNTYTDKNVAASTTYYYIVTGALSGGETGPSNVAKTIIGTSLYAQLKFDEGSGDTAADSTGHGWTGTLVHGPQWTTGALDHAITLANASSQYLSLPSGVVSDLSDFTIAAWVYLKSSPVQSRIFDFGTGTERYMYLTTNNGSGARFAITGCGHFGEEDITSTVPLPTGRWVHVAVTLNGSAGTLYVNGKVVGTNPLIAFTPSRLGVTTNNWIGRSQFEADPYLNGQVADFRIYRGALTPAELTSLIATRKSVNPP